MYRSQDTLCKPTLFEPSYLCMRLITFHTHCGSFTCDTLYKTCPHPARTAPAFVTLTDTLCLTKVKHLRPSSQAISACAYVRVIQKPIRAIASTALLSRCAARPLSCMATILPIASSPVATWPQRHRAAQVSNCYNDSFLQRRATCKGSF